MSSAHESEQARREDPTEDLPQDFVAAYQASGPSDGHASSRAGFEIPLNLDEITAATNVASTGGLAVLPPLRPEASQR